MEGDQVNTELVATIVREVKSQGVFDQFRKECLADVDTKPAYQNLRQRVETSVTTFLEQQEWRPDANRIQMREKLRKNIIGLGFLETGVDRIVDQVVNPKISSVFLPQIEDIVYKYLGIEKPVARPKEEPQGSFEHNGVADLLPTDLLEAVSPDSSKSAKSAFSSNDDIKEEITEEEIIADLDESNDRIDDEESPPFEPLEGLPDGVVKKEDEDESQNSHVSGISGLTSQDSLCSTKNPPEPMEVDEVKTEEEEMQEEHQEEVMQPPRIDQMIEKSEVPERTVSDAVEAMEVANQDSQLSQVSSNSRLSIVTNESDSKDDSLKIDLSEEAQMPEFGENSQSPRTGKVTTFDINKDEIKFQQARIFPPPPEPENPPPLPPSPPPPLEDKPKPPAPPESEPPEVKKEEVKSEEDPMSLEKISSGEKIAEKDARREKHHSSDRKKSKKTSRSSHHSHEHRDKSRSSSSREKGTKSSETSPKGEDNSSTAMDSDASPVLQIVESETLDGGDSQQSTATAEKSTKGNSSHRSSSHHDRKKSHSSHSKDSHRRDHRRHHDKHKSSSQKSSGRSDRKSKDEGTSSKRKDKESDDHSSQREKHSEKRRSTDRDSNDGSSGSKQATPPANDKSGANPSSGTAEGSANNSANSSVSNSPQDKEASPKTETAAFDAAANTSADSAEKVVMQSKPIIVDQILTANSEINLQMIVNQGSNDPTLAKIEELAKKSLEKKKPKFASNFKEAKRLMKMRKKIDHENKKNMEKAIVLAKNYINSKAESDPTVSDLSQGIELEFACMKSSGNSSAPTISSPVKKEVAPTPKSPEKPPSEESEKIPSSSRAECGDSEDEEELLYFPDPLCKFTESITEKWLRENGDDILKDDEKPSPEGKAKKSPKNGILGFVHPSGMIRKKRSLDLSDNKDDDKEEKRVRIAPNKFGDLNGNEDVIEEKKAVKVKTPLTQQQRYSSDDLYKPRPFIHGQRTRRRGLDTSDGGTA